MSSEFYDAFRAHPGEQIICLVPQIAYSNKQKAHQEGIWVVRPLNLQQLPLVQW